MEQVSEGELRIWDAPLPGTESKLSTQQINDKYVRGEQRIVTETNREKLPNFVEALKRPGYMELRPVYQRRERWDDERKSKLIESFIINIPVPPIFLYEKAYNSYEVMDGQQRITAIREFYENRLRLKGLDLWPELIGMTYDELPSQVKAGIDRRSISSIVLLKESSLKESSPRDEEAVLLRELVFERLNTGGVKLERQEIRNALYQGPLNNLLHRLAKTDIFRTAWGLPLYSEEEEQERRSAPIFKLHFFQQMEDLEVVLRFFALRHVQHYRFGMQGFLDLYMVRARDLEAKDIQFLEDLFHRTIGLAVDIYGESVFRPYDPEAGEWTAKPQKAFYDAVMVGLSKFLDQRDRLVERRERVINETRELFITYEPGTFTGRGNSKKDIEERTDHYVNMLTAVLAE